MLDFLGQYKPSILKNRIISLNNIVLRCKNALLFEYLLRNNLADIHL
jgi:hypothetical protein